MKRYNKLIRDRIPEVIAADGKRCKVRILSNDELPKQLLAKLNEEVDELQRKPCVEEIADILEVLIALAPQLGCTMDEVERIRRDKHTERGGFEKRLFLEYVE